MTREEAIKELDSFIESNVQFFPQKPRDAIIMAYYSLKGVNRIEHAMPNILTSEFEAYVYHVLLTIDEEE